MVPSLPIELPKGSKLIHVFDNLECSMIRFGVACTDTTNYAFICPMPSRFDWFIPFCERCAEEASDYIYQHTGKTWLQLAEQVGGLRS